MVLALTGKVAFTSGFQLIYVVTAEIYPTQYRSFAIGVASFCGRIGSILSPYINDLLVSLIYKLRVFIVCTNNYRIIKRTLLNIFEIYANKIARASVPMKLFCI